VERSGHWRRLAGGEELECLGSGAGRRDAAVQAGETEQPQDMWLVADHVQAGSVRGRLAGSVAERPLASY
jgi:hypothetical protein